ncbi:MAG: hypothetical protein RSC43_00020 [Clostridia bacterium]
MKSNKQKLKKFMTRIIVVLVIVCSAFYIYKIWRVNNGQDILIEGTYKSDRIDGSNAEPTAELFNKMLPDVLRRVSSVRDSSMELPIIEQYTKQIDDKFGCVTNILIENYLGNYQLRLNVAINGTTDILELQNFICETIYPAFDLTDDFVRIQVAVSQSITPIKRFHLTRSTKTVPISDLDYIEDENLMKLDIVNEELVSKVTKALEGFSETSKVTVITGDSSKAYDQFRVVLDTSLSEAATEDCVNCLDTLFVYFNDQKRDTYVQVYEGENLQFSAWIEPHAQQFTDFYTDKEYYQDISRVEYYLCNGWVYGNSLNYLDKLISNLL